MRDDDVNGDADTDSESILRAKNVLWTGRKPIKGSLELMFAGGSSSVKRVFKELSPRSMVQYAVIKFAFA